MENRKFRLICQELLSFFILIAVTGCGSTRRKECNLLMGKINEGVAQVEAHERERLIRPEGGHVQTAQSMRQLSKMYQSISQEVRTVELSDKELKALAEDYQFEVRSAGSAAEALAIALDGKRQEQAITADQVYSKHIANQKKIVEKINATCTR